MEELLANADEGSRHLYNLLTWVLLLSGILTAGILLWHQRRNPPDTRALTARIAERSWSSLQILVLIGSLFLLYFAASFSGLLFYEDQIPVAQLVITLLIYAVLAAIITLINRKRGGSWATSCGMGLRQTRSALLAPVYYLAFIPLLMLAARAYHLLLQYMFHVEIELQQVAQVVVQQLSWLEVCYILMAVLVAPIYEELLFRGVVFPYLVKRVGLGGGTALVSILFATLHFHLPSFVPLYLLSTALCLAYWRTGSLWTGIGMHILFNGITIFALNIVG